MEEIYCFAGNPLDRVSQRRQDAGWVASLLEDPASPGGKPPPLPSAAAPLVAKLGAGGPLEIPAKVPLGGRILVTETNGVPVNASFTNERPGKTDRTLLVVVPVSDRERVLVIAWTPLVAPAPMPSVAQQRADPLAAGKASFFDLDRDTHRSFRLEVPEGGLYRIETLGRLKTAVTIGTAFLPKIADASDNGAGHNALLQTYLRAGSYRVEVSASDSNGHLGILASPAPLLDAGTLAAEESVRATLAEGGGAVVAIDVPESGKYRLDLYGLDRMFTTRLEDAEGWPLTVPSPLAKLERAFAAGRYRLVVLPEPVEARLVARLRRNAEPPALDGHGPHRLAFDGVQKFEWHEPQAKDAPRVPDRWEFALAGPAHVVLDISDGMIGDLLHVDADPQPVAKIAYKRGFSGVLQAGRYALEARALGRNDRLDYELTLRSTELQPGVARFVDLPASLPFAVTDDRVASLTTFGRTELSGVLRGEDGRVIERLVGRADDWNIALSRRLPSGAYRLDLSPLSAQAAGSGDDTPASDASEAPSDGDQPSESGIEVRLAVPEVAEARALAFTGSEHVTEARVHEFVLPQADTGDLVLLAAQSTAELVISLERRDADGTWRSAGFEQGRAPVIAFPSDGDAARPWRASAWAVDGGAAPITIAARDLREPAQAMGQGMGQGIGEVALKPFAIEGFAQPVRVAALAVPGASLVTLKGASPELRQGSTQGRPLRATEGGVLTPQSDRLWLIANGAGSSTVAVEPLTWNAPEIAIVLAGGEAATLPRTAVPDGQVRVWKAVSSFGQPGLSTGRGTGIAPGSALALAGDEGLRAWNAGGEDGLRLRLASLDLTLRPPLTAEAALSIALPPRSAQPIRLRNGAKHIGLDLAAGLGAFASGGDSHQLSVWAADTAVSREAEGDWTDILVVNTGDKVGAASFSQTPATGVAGLAAGGVFKRFFGATGSLALAIAAKPGDRLGVGGATATFVSDKGEVLRGTSLTLPGPGDLVLEHQAGLIAAWLGNDTLSPWPAATASPLAAPQSVKLEGAAMSFTLKQGVPALLHARTSAPVILVLKQGDTAGEPVLFPAGAEFHHYVAAGGAELSLYSPHEGSLGGTLELTATPVTPMAEGLGETLALAPGATALYGFEVTRAGSIGVGVRAEPDLATARLLDAAGKSLGEGVAQLRRLEPGRYFLEVRAPADGGTLTIRPALIGLTPPSAGPPPEIAKDYLEMVGLTSRAR